MREVIVFIALTFSVTVQAQRLTQDEALQRVYDQHPAVLAATRTQQQQQALRGAAIDLPKTDINFMTGQYNSISKQDNNVTIIQTIPFPTLWGRQRQLAQAQVDAAGQQVAMTRNDLALEVRRRFQQLLYVQAAHQLLQRQDSLMTTLLRAVDLRYQTGEGTLLEKTAVETQRADVQNLLQQNELERQSIAIQLQVMLQTPEPVTAAGHLEKLPEPALSLESNPGMQYWRQQSVIAQRQRQVEVGKTLPDLSVGYFNQTLIGYQTVNGQEQYFGSSKRFQGFTVGVAIPLWFHAFQSRIKAATYNQEAVDYHQKAYVNTLQRDAGQALQELEKQKRNLAYYEQTALPNAGLLEKQSLTAFRQGEIDYAVFMLNLRQALTLRENHLQTLLQYNQIVITLQHFNGNF